MKWFVRGLLILLILVMLAVGATYFYLQSTKPQYKGKVALNGLKNTSKVYFDSHGVPHISADNMQDAYFALGYVHAQDRLFQMDLLRRIGSGRLSEFFGKRTIEIDRFMRTLGLDQHAKVSAKAFKQQKDKPFYKAAVAYMKGFNNFIKKGKTPIEYQLLGVEKEELTIENMFHIFSYMGFSFAAGHRTDPLLTELNKTLGKDYIKDLRVNTADEYVKIPVNYPKATDNVNTGGVAHAIHNIVKQIPAPVWFGSNSWVVSGKNTQSGKVILSNDTHIAYAQPSVWFEAHIEYPGFSFYGNHLAGIPFGVVGHTRHHAWGLTMLENDDIDFYVEKPNPANNNQVWENDHWQNLDIRQEVIKVKDGDNVRFRVKTSRHGPLIQDVLDGLKPKPKTPKKEAKKEKKKSDAKKDGKGGKAKKPKVKAPKPPKLKGLGKKKKKKKEEGAADSTGKKATDKPKVVVKPVTPVSIYWVMTKFTNRSLEALFKIAHGKTMGEVAEAAAIIHSPGLNLMYGDREGNIAWWAVSKLLKRRPGINSKFFMDGASGKDEPLGYYTFEENPKSVNPESGFIYSANNQPGKMNNGLYYPGYYAPDFRAGRIYGWLTRTNRWNMSKMQGMITDGTSGVYPQVAQELVKVLEADQALKNNKKAQEVIQRLKDWKGKHNLDNVGATIYYKLLAHILQKTCEDEMGPQNFATFIDLFLIRRTIPALIKNKNSLWWDNMTTLTQRETRADIFRESLLQTIKDYESQLGKKVKNWKWKKVHTLEHGHALQQGGPLLKRLFNVGPNAVMGGHEVINNLSFSLKADTEKFAVRSGPAMRLIVDFENVDKSVSVLPTGQSGNFMSPFYDDQTELFNTGRFRPMHMYSRDSINTKLKPLLILNPGK
ncbi:MAG TPA: penicillin acylase family protein [Microscillaceae bacterium]|nr:penicillin acylase family protein [Microscillaceae bacterium]